MPDTKKENWGDGTDVILLITLGRECQVVLPPDQHQIRPLVQAIAQCEEVSKESVLGEALSSRQAQCEKVHKESVCGWDPLIQVGSVRRAM